MTSPGGGTSAGSTDHTDPSPAACSDPGCITPLYIGHGSEVPSRNPDLELDLEPTPGFFTERRRARPEYCPVSVIHAHDEGDRRDGRCVWCGYRYRAPAPMPTDLGRSYRTKLDLEYRRHYDPDFGNDPFDY
jgi:hypothetical protein